MGSELELDRLAGGLPSDLFDLAGVAVAHHPIGGHRLGGLSQQQVFLGSPTATGGAALGIDHDAGRFDQPLLEKGQQGQQAGGGKTARGRHQAGGADASLLPLHQAVNSLLAEGLVGSGHLASLGGIHLLPLGQGAVAVVGREIHHLHTPLKELGNQARRQAIGQAQHRQIGRRRDRLRVGGAHHRIARQRHKGHQITPAAAAAALAAQKGHREGGVILEQAQGLQTPIAAGSDHRDACACHAGAERTVDRTGLYNCRSSRPHSPGPSRLHSPGPEPGTRGALSGGERPGCRRVAVRFDRRWPGGDPQRRIDRGGGR